MFKDCYWEELWWSWDGGCTFGVALWFGHREVLVVLEGDGERCN